MEESALDPSVIDDRRLINMTEKAEENFQDRVNKFQEKLIESRWKVEEILNISDLSDKQNIKQRHSTICLAYAEYRLLCRDFVAYLQGSRTQKGCDILNSHRENDMRFDKTVNRVLACLEEMRTQIELESESAKSRNSRSSISSSIIKARARAEAAKVRIEFVEKEALLRKQEAALKEEEALSLARAERKRSDIQAELQVLQEHRLCAEAEAEAEIWDSGSVSRQSVADSVLPSDVELAAERTKKFVETHSTSSIDSANSNMLQKTALQTKKGDRRVFAEVYNASNQTQLDPNVPDFVPLSVTIATEMSKFFVKKDLLFSRLTPFSDAPEEYVAWKTGFQQITQEMGVSTTEEIDLLIKWLGPQSRKHSIS